MKSASTCDVAIIGGGIIGLSCAWRLAQRGAKVHLFERGQIGREASRAAAGMLAAQVEAAVHPPQNEGARKAFLDLCLKSRALYPSFVAELDGGAKWEIRLSLHEKRGGDWRTPGILYVPTRDDDFAPQAFADQKKNEQRVEESMWRERAALWLPDEGHVNNRLVVASLRSACERARVEIYCGEPVREIELRNELILKTASQPRVLCDKVLLCAGAWSGTIEGLSPEVEIPVRPVAGEVLEVRPQKRLIHQIVYSSDVYLVPRVNGKILIGATMEERSFDKATTHDAMQKLLSAAIDLLPELRDAPVRDHWAGLRPATPDGLPIIGSTPLENLFVATGHFRNGILLAPITAQLMADCILEGKEPPREFALERFHNGVLAS